MHIKDRLFFSVLVFQKCYAKAFHLPIVVSEKAVKATETQRGIAKEFRMATELTDHFGYDFKVNLSMDNNNNNANNNEDDDAEY